MTNFSETFLAIQKCLEDRNAKKFELEEVDGERQTVLITSELIFSLFVSDHVDRKEIIASYAMTPSGIAEFVRKHDIMFFENNKERWVKYKTWTELAEYLAEFAPNTNFAVDYHELKHHHFGE